MNANKELLEKLGATIHAHVAPAVGFKNCCMLTGEYDGSDRDHFF